MECADDAPICRAAEADASGGHRLRELGSYGETKNGHSVPPALQALQDPVRADLNGSNVAVYGTIYLKTDGERLITAFRIETASETRKWFAFEYIMTEDGELELVD